MGFSRLPLLWRVFAINAGLLLIGTLVLVLSPSRLHTSVAVVETLDLFVVLVVMLVAAFVGVVSGLIPSYRASNLGIVDALRYIG